MATRSDREIFHIEEKGSVISLKWPWLASSSDGDIWIFGRKVGIIEIKSPKGSRVYVISPTYYYPQIQGNMHMHGVGFCKFITYSDEDWEPLQVDHYEYDVRYCREWLFPKLHRFYFSTLLPQLMVYFKASTLGTPEEKFAARFPAGLPLPASACEAHPTDGGGGGSQMGRARKEAGGTRKRKAPATPRKPAASKKGNWSSQPDDGALSEFV